MSRSRQRRVTDGGHASAGDATVGIAESEGGPTGTVSDRIHGSLSVLDRACYTLFASNADDTRHGRDREHYRGAGLSTGFDLYLARAYALAWATGVLAVVPVLFAALLAPASVYDGLARLLASAAPAVGVVPRPPRLAVAVVAGSTVGWTGRWAVLALAGRYLAWRATHRRASIERTLPGAARYLHALSSGAGTPRAMLRRVADNDAYGETAASFRSVLATAALTGSLDEGLRREARDTPASETMGPFLLKFREHAGQGEDALANYLRLESRMLGHSRARDRGRKEDQLEFVGEAFVVTLVLPALFVIVLTVVGVLSPGLSRPIPTPLGPVTGRLLFVLAAIAFVLVVGAGAALTVATLRPPEREVTYDRPATVLALLRTTPTNPASAALTLLPLGGLGIVGGLLAGVRPVSALLAGYVAYALPVGLVALRRARLDDAKDRQVQDFVHAVSGHVSLGNPFSAAVARVARDADLGPLTADVSDLAYTLSLSAGPTPETDRRTAALDRFVDRVGTPLSAGTMGLVTGALDAGSDGESLFETLQTEVGLLFDEKRELRATLAVYVLVGWVTALLVVCILVAVDGYVLDGFAQLSSMPTGSGFSVDPNAIDPARDRFRFYLIAQATALASGWFAGMASRGPYEALLHSGALSVCTYGCFAVSGVL